MTKPPLFIQNDDTARSACTDFNKGAEHSQSNQSVRRIKKRVLVIESKPRNNSLSETECLDVSTELKI